MSFKVCCLCCASCGEYVSLQNNSGKCNEIYEITVKYFDPVLITDYVNSKCLKEKVLCQYCWLHIKEFHEFHQTVINARLVLEQTKSGVSSLPLQVALQDKSITCMSEKQSTEDEEFSEIEDIFIKSEPCDEEIAFKGHFDIGGESDEGNDDLAKPRKGQKRKHVSEQHTKEITCNVNDKINKPLRKGKIFKDVGKPKRNPRVNSGLEMGRESNKFIAEWKPLLECDLCNETFPVFDVLKSHFKDKHNTRCYIKCCERKFHRRCSLVDHIRLHINPEVHKCDICGRQNSSKYNLKLHKKVVHEETEKFECEVCHRYFNQKITLDRHHLLTHGIGDLKKHSMDHARIERPKYPCGDCGAQLISLGNLRRHKAAYHNEHLHGILNNFATSVK